MAIRNIRIIGDEILTKKAKEVKEMTEKTRELVQAIQTAPDEAYRYFGNLFESAVNLGEVADIKARMFSHGALSSVMTGSGSAVFGSFSDRRSAEICSRELAENGFFSQVCETVANSFTEI